MTRKEERKHDLSETGQLPKRLQKIEARNDKPMDAHTGQDGKVDGRKMSGDFMSTSKDEKDFLSGL